MFPREFGKIAAYLRKKLWLEWSRRRRFAGRSVERGRGGGGEVTAAGQLAAVKASPPFDRARLLLGRARTRARPSRWRH